MSTVLPGQSIGVIGGGQLGRYFVLEGRRLGYEVWVLDPNPQAPAMQVATKAIVADYDDKDALIQLGDACEAVTVEFENVPSESLHLLSSHCRIAPSAENIKVAQDRLLEKRTAEKHGLQPVPFAGIENRESINEAVSSVGLPAILKTCRLGYDGKGQAVCHSVEEVESAFINQGEVPCVLERRIDLQAEISVVLARGFDETIVTFPVATNTHQQGILHTSVVPSNQSERLINQALDSAKNLAKGIDYHGVLAVEFFIDSQDNLYFNEMAPRPHNSGHYTLDATASSQFEQQLRVLCELPLGSCELLTPVCMLNLMGESWGDSHPEWLSVLTESSAKLHLYGKAEARPGRKMGHINCLASTPEDAHGLANKIHHALNG